MEKKKQIVWLQERQVNLAVSEQNWNKACGCENREFKGTLGATVLHSTQHNGKTKYREDFKNIIRDVLSLPL